MYFYCRYDSESSRIGQNAGRIWYATSPKHPARYGETSGSIGRASLDDPDEYVLVEAFQDDGAGVHVGSDALQASHDRHGPGPG